MSCLAGTKYDGRQEVQQSMQCSQRFSGSAIDQSMVLPSTLPLATSLPHRTCL